MVSGWWVPMWEFQCVVGFVFLANSKFLWTFLGFGTVGTVHFRCWLSVSCIALVVLGGENLCVGALLV